MSTARSHARLAASRRTVVSGVAALAAGAFLAACGSSSSAASSSSRSAAAQASIAQQVPAGTTLRVADQLNFIENLLADSGQNTGFTYKLDYSNFVGGPPMLQAFQAGSVDAGYVADTPIIFAQAAGQPITAAAVWAPTNGSDALVSAPRVKLSGWASLKGKKVAYQQGTVEEAVVLEGLKSVGLSVHDITPVNLATTSITPALENGAVAAGVLVQPLTAAYLTKNPTASQVEVGNDITARVAMLITSQSAFTNPAKEAALANFISRLEKAYQWVNTHQAQYAQDLYVNEYKVPLAAGEKLLAASGPTSFLTLPGDLVGPQQTLADLYLSAGEIPAKVNVASEFSDTFDNVVKANQ